MNKILLASIPIIAIVFLGCSGDNSASAEGNAELSQHKTESTILARYQDGCSGTEYAAAFGQMTTVLNMKSIFTDACKFHDDCYHSGKAAYNVSRSYCDTELRSKAIAKCKSTYDASEVFPSASHSSSLWSFGYSLFTGDLSPAATVTATNLAGKSIQAHCIANAEIVYAGVTAGAASYYKSTPCANGEFIYAYDTTCVINGTPTTCTRVYNYTCSTYEFSSLISKTPAIPERVALIKNDKTLWALDGPTLSSNLTALDAGVSSVKLSGFRIGAVLTTGIAEVKEGVLSSIWYNQEGGVAQLEMIARQDSNRIVVLLTNGTVKMKEGGLSAIWVTLASGAKAIDVYKNRIGALISDGSLYVKEGSSGAAWVWETGNVKSFQLEGTRIGVLLTDGGLSVKEGGLSTAWVSENGNVKSFQLDGTRIGALLNDGGLYVKEGGLSTAWVPEIGNVKSFQLDGTRIGALTNDGHLYVKEGGLSTAWVDEHGSVKDFRIVGDRIGVLLNDGTLKIKDGALGAVWVTVATNVAKFEMNDVSEWSY